MMTFKRQKGRYIVEVNGLPVDFDTLHDALAFINFIPRFLKSRYMD